MWVHTFVSSRQVSESIESELVPSAIVKIKVAYLEGAQQALVDTHHRSCVVKFATIVWCTEQCDELALREELITIFHNLMGTTDQIHIVFL